MIINWKVGQNSSKLKNREKYKMEKKEKSVRYMCDKVKQSKLCNFEDVEEERRG